MEKITDQHIKVDTEVYRTALKKQSPNAEKETQYDYLREKYNKIHHRKGHS